MVNTIGTDETWGTIRGKINGTIRIGNDLRLASRSRVIADPGITIGGAGGWKGAFGDPTIDSTKQRRPGVSTLLIDGTGSSGSYVNNFRHVVTSSTLTGPFELWQWLTPRTAGNLSISVRYSSDNPAADPPTSSPTNYIEQVFDYAQATIRDGFWMPLIWSPNGKVYSYNLPDGRAPTITGTPDSTNIKQIEIIINWNSATPAAEKKIWFDQVAINGKAKPKLILGFDGYGYNTAHTTIAIPTFDRYGIKGYNAGDGDAAVINSSKLDAMYARGWDIITQGIAHIDYAANSNQLSANYDQAKSILTSLGYIRSLDQFAYPFNSRSLTTDAILRSKGIRMARAGIPMRIVTSSLGSQDLLITGCIDMGQKTAAQFSAYIDDMIRCGYSQSLLFHDIQTTASASTITATSEFLAMIAYAADKHYAGDIEIVTPTQFANFAE